MLTTSARRRTAAGVAAALVPSANAGLAGTVAVLLNGDPVDGLQQIDFAGDPVAFELPFAAAGTAEIGVSFTPAQADAYQPAETSLDAPTLSTTRAVYGSGPVTASVVVPGAQQGAVTFTDNGRTIGRANVDSNGRAVIELAKSEAGAHDIAARFGGSANQAASAVSDEARLSVTRATTSKVSVSGKSFKKQTRPTVKVRVAKLSNGAYPVGTVTVKAKKR